MKKVKAFLIVKMKTLNLRNIIPSGHKNILAEIVRIKSSMQKSPIHEASSKNL